MRWLRRTCVVLVLASGGLFLGPVTPACACSCKELTPEESRDEADLVFAGTVTEIDRPLFVLSSADPVTVTLAVSRAYKGEVATRMTLTTPLDGASCGYPFVEGKEYLVFARRDGGEITTSLCAGNQDLATEVGPLPGGYSPVAAPPERRSVAWPVGIVVGAGVGVALAIGAVFWFRRRRRDPLDHEVGDAQSR